MIPVASERVAGPARARGARLLAVQALYQAEQTGASHEQVLEEFLVYRLNQPQDDQPARAVDATLFSAIIRSFAVDQAAIDAQLSDLLTADWPLHRLESIVRALLRAGAAELRPLRGRPRAAVINDYVELTKDFCAGKEPGLVNAVLDRIGSSAA